MDIDRTLSFIQVTCNSTEEAKRRAYVIAALTYDIHQGIFVRMSTSEMLEDPFMIRNIFKIRERFGIDPEAKTETRESEMLERFIKDKYADQGK